MFLRDRQVVDFQGAHIRLDGFLDVGQRGILRFALGDAAGKAGALGDPEAIFPAIDENLSHTFIMPDSKGDKEKAIGWLERRQEAFASSQKLIMDVPETYPGGRRSRAGYS